MMLSIFSCAYLPGIYLFFFFFCTTWHAGILVPPPGIQPMPPAVEVQSLNYWTAREVPRYLSSLVKCLFESFAPLFIYLFIKYLFIIYVFVCAGVLVAAPRIYIAACCVWDLHCGMWNIVSWPGIEPGFPTLGAWNLSHWTTREVPVGPIFLIRLLVFFSSSFIQI